MPQTFQDEAQSTQAEVDQGQVVDGSLRRKNNRYTRPCQTKLFGVTLVEKTMFKIRAKSKFDRQQSPVCNFLLPASCRPTDELVVRTAAEAISDCET